MVGQSIVLHSSVSNLAMIRHSAVMSYDRSIASSRASPAQKAIQGFLFLFPGSSRLLKVTQFLLTSFSSSFRHFYSSLYLHFSNGFGKTLFAPDVTYPILLTSSSSSFQHFYSSLYLHFSNGFAKILFAPDVTYPILLTSSSSSFRHFYSSLYLHFSNGFGKTLFAPDVT